MPRLPRASGILLHPTSLPGPYGIGEIGSAAHHFLDLLRDAGQSLWQVLPLTPTGYGASPYASPSAFAGNPLLIALDPLLEGGLLHEEDMADLRALPRAEVDFVELEPRKRRALRTAFQRFHALGVGESSQQFEAFREHEAAWLDDYTLFAALHAAFGRPWSDWEPALRDREGSALEAARNAQAEAVDFEAWLQYVFAEQWGALRGHARSNGVRLVGDIPIFVALDSADVWAHRAQFKLDPLGRPTVVAGVPPDYFSRTGQLWGNPLYDWQAVAADEYRWWVARFRQLLRDVDIVRIDHFRGFQAAWEVPASAETAERGRWVPGPGAALFRALEQAFDQPVPIMAEDLGLITPEVRALLAELGYPGMKVLQFAFGGGPDNLYLPHNFTEPNCVVYTGTHDNDTTRGWYASAQEHERDFARRYLAASGDDIAWDCIRAALASVADTAILPLQDVLDLGSEARMNVPGSAERNWAWRVTEERMEDLPVDRLRDLTYLYGRLADPQPVAGSGAC